MKKYEKPVIEEEVIEIADIIMESGNISAFGDADE